MRKYSHKRQGSSLILGVTNDVFVLDRYIGWIVVSDVFPDDRTNPIRIAKKFVHQATKILHFIVINVDEDYARFRQQFP